MKKILIFMLLFVFVGVSSCTPNEPPVVQDIEENYSTNFEYIN